jgi:hypothetical protein
MKTKLNVIQIIFILFTLYIFYYIYSNFVFKYELDKVFYNVNYLNDRQFFVDCKFSDSLKINTKNNTFSSYCYGSGKFKIKHTYKGTEIRFFHISFTDGSNISTHFLIKRTLKNKIKLYKTEEESQFYISN